MARKSIDDDARAEDLAWMAATGETPEGAAARLGISVDGLEHWAKRQGHYDLIEQLRRNDAVRAAA